MDYRKGDIFVHKEKGIVAVLTKVEDGMYSYVHSKPVKGETWSEIKEKPVEQIHEAVENGTVVLYRPKVSMFDEDLFEAE